MARKGESKNMKRLTAPKTVKVERKSHKFIVRPSAGPHTKDQSVPLAVIMREILNIASTAREVKMVLNDGKVTIDGKIVKDHRRPVGFMDVVSFPTVNKYYRMVYDHKGRLVPNEIDVKNSTFKLCKVKNKTRISSGKIQVNLHDGKNILYDKACVAGDVLKLEVPSLKVLEIYPFVEGNMAYVTGGTHAGDVAKIQSITKGTMMRKPLAVLEKDGETFQTRKGYVFIIGQKEAAIKL